MLQTFQVENVKCGGCATTLKNKLSTEFGEISVNLDTLPREITLEINQEKIPTLRAALISLGYPMSDEDLNLVENTTTKAKSFISCAVGKVDNFSNTKN